MVGLVWVGSGEGWLGDQRFGRVVVHNELGWWMLGGSRVSPGEEPRVHSDRVFAGCSKGLRELCWEGCGVCVWWGVVGWGRGGG